MSYIPVTVKILNSVGYYESMKAMRLPKPQSFSDSTPSNIGTDDLRLASQLILQGDSHAKALRGIVVYFQITMQIGFMIEFETYRCGVETLSTTSAMNEMVTLTGTELAQKKQEDLVSRVYTRIVTISYQTLRRMYRERRNHRHPDWQIFCQSIEQLSYFNQLIFPEARNKT
jgi:hypothetical protein